MLSKKKNTVLSKVNNNILDEDDKIIMKERKKVRKKARKKECSMNNDISKNSKKRKKNKIYPTDYNVDTPTILCVQCSVLCIFGCI